MASIHNLSIVDIHTIFDLIHYNGGNVVWGLASVFNKNSQYFKRAMESFLVFSTIDSEWASRRDEHDPTIIERTDEIVSFDDDVYMTNSSISRFCQHGSNVIHLDIQNSLIGDLGIMHVAENCPKLSTIRMRNYM